MLADGEGFPAGAYKWLFLGPVTAKYTQPKVPSGLLEGIACAVVPWRPHDSLPPVTTMFCDVACQGGAYYVGQWGHELGMRIKRLPDWVATLPSRRRSWRVVDTVKLCAYRGKSFVRLYGDNLSSLSSAVNDRTATVCGT